jgi:hypothetical protein
LSTKPLQFPDRQEPDYSGVIDSLREVGQRRRETLIRLKRARMAKDVDLTFRIVDELVPDSVLDSHDKALPTTVESVHGRTSRRR